MLGAFAVDVIDGQRMHVVEAAPPTAHFSGGVVLDDRKFASALSISRFGRVAANFIMSSFLSLRVPAQAANSTPTVFAGLVHTKSSERFGRKASTAKFFHL